MKLELDKIQQYGIVGAGGAGFPTYQKLTHKAHTVILNGAECEPLMHKDKELLKHFSSLISTALLNIMETVDAERGFIGIKGKYTDVVERMQQTVEPPLEIMTLGDFYPAGDEIVLIELLTKTVIPAGDLPSTHGFLVQNVETVLNIGLEKPVTNTVLTVAGNIPEAVTLSVPVGTILEDLLRFLEVPDYWNQAVLLGGAMMGTLVSDKSIPLTKTAGGIIILPPEHPLIKKYSRERKNHVAIGSSCCDQCALCTDLCPRFLLGHPIEPHLAMRSLQMPERFHELNMGDHFCCECNLCSLMSCPIDLDPKDICAHYKHTHPFVADKLVHPPTNTVHPVSEFRRVSLARLMDRLGLSQYKKDAPLKNLGLPISRVTIPLKQHIGSAAIPCINQGDSVHRGQMIAQAAPGKLSVSMHASIDGTISRITEEVIEIIGS